FFFPEWDPVVALSAVAAVTTRIKTGTLVYGVDYRHPVVLARAAATAHALSGGRVEFGIGAGWTEADYVEAGLRYDPAGARVERLEEALHVIKGIWTNERTTFSGQSYQVKGAQRAVDLPSLPRILIGGGGKKVLGVAGRHADIVGINPKVAEGKITANAARDGMLERTREKIRWVEEAATAAGRDFDALELNALVFGTVITDDPKPTREFLGKQAGMSPDDVAASPLYLVGSAREIQDTLQRRREELGFNYVVIQGRDFALLEKFAAEVVTPLAKADAR
ncbi:MAG TPA: TIGR03621 family F420-dependent LLM class oxidoreductase, partial [Myxococcota bacterium]|nr:TIGR03621 family F420-dependent LLM class oxidoreductase [Myxococcota bacterium]